MEKEKKLQKINTKWLQECTCTLKETATQGVPGSGSATSKIVFIGEAPGKNEDSEGKPFVGRAGKFLNEMLDIIHLKREDVYITNIVKYRPPNNRDPRPEEIESCKKWLQEELLIIQPALIIFLGRHAMNHFFPTEKISDVHGKLLKKELSNLGVQHFLALYHPAAALYNGNMRKVLIEDFKKIPLYLKKINQRSLE